MKRKENSKEIINNHLSHDMKIIRNKVAQMGVPTSPVALSVEDTSLGQESGDLAPENFGLQNRLEQKMQIPRPPEIKKLIIPKMNKGPLFISRNKFFEAESLVQEMSGMSTTLEDELLKIEETLQGDRNTIAQLDSILSAVENKVNALSKIVTP